MTSTPAPWWRPDVYADRRPFLMARARIVAAVRAFFAVRGFVEVETPILQRSPGNEVHLHAFSTVLEGPDGSAAEPLYLHTSPEFACKKLIAAGEPRLFTLARVFRNRERGRRHHPEFTMLEWYRADEPYEALMDDCAALLRVAADAAGRDCLAFGGLECDPGLAPERITVAEAVGRSAGIDLLASLADPERPDRDALAAAAAAAGIRVAADDGWSDIFSRTLVERVEPGLGSGRAAILCEYPAPEAALARRKPGDPRVAERFELYACGVELANAFGELTDADEQRRRFAADMAEKERRYGVRHPIDEDFLAAVAAMPPASGIALGVDRLVMLATGARRIEDVLWAPVAGGDV
jgi:lysyl-tRNA synthetase class 2